MGAGSSKFTLGRIAVLSLTSLWLVGCTNNNPPAPISPANGAEPPSTGSRMLITPPPTGRTMTAPSPQPVKNPPLHSPQIKPVASPPVKKVTTQPVKNVDGKIVYSRKYDDIPKGSYTGGSTYTVKHGDTLFYIAWVTGNDFRDLAQRNNIAEPYDLRVGQTLKVGSSVEQPDTNSNVTAQKTTSKLVTPPPEQKSPIVVASQPVITYSEKTGEQSDNKMLPNAKTVTTKTAVVPVTAPAVSSNQLTASSESTSVPVIKWRWPTDGKIIENFSGAEGGNKGIDIAGSKGQAIIAAASGRVVYAGNALRGYGNLIIVKHNDDYLSAYAHNDTMLVREQQEVKAGQKIATMGSTGTSSTRLHFEIRYKGKSVNPLQYLPQR